MYGVCLHCRTDHPIKLSTEKEMGAEFVEAKCIVCGSLFTIHKQKAICPYCKRELYLSPNVIDVDKSELIYENQPVAIEIVYEIVEQLSGCHCERSVAISWDCGACSEA